MMDQELIEICKEYFKKYWFIGLLLIFALTFFTRNNFRSVDIIVPEVLRQPLQQECANKDIIRFTRDGYKYEITPLYDYDISAMVVSKISYGLTIEKVDKVFPVDLCMVWRHKVQSPGFFQ